MFECVPAQIATLRGKVMPARGAVSARVQAAGQRGWSGLLHGKLTEADGVCPYRIAAERALNDAHVADRNQKPDF